MNSAVALSSSAMRIRTPCCFLLVVVHFTFRFVLDHVSGLAVDADLLNVTTLLNVERVAPCACFPFVLTRNEFAGSELERLGLGCSHRDPRRGCCGRKRHSANADQGHGG